MQWNLQHLQVLVHWRGTFGHAWSHILCLFHHVSLLLLQLQEFLPQAPPLDPRSAGALGIPEADDSSEDAHLEDDPGRQQEGAAPAVRVQQQPAKHRIHLCAMHGSVMHRPQGVFTQMTRRQHFDATAETDWTFFVLSIGRHVKVDACASKFDAGVKHSDTALSVCKPPLRLKLFWGKVCLVYGCMDIVHLSQEYGGTQLLRTLGFQCYTRLCLPHVFKNCDFCLWTKSNCDPNSLWVAAFGYVVLPGELRPDPGVESTL